VSVLSSRKVEAALLKKGFARDDGDHRWLVLFDKDGKKTKVRTKTSHNQQDIDPYLQSHMSKQMQLTKMEFLLFISCEITGYRYLEILIARGKI